MLDIFIDLVNSPIIIPLGKLYINPMKNIFKITIFTLLIIIGNKNIIYSSEYDGNKVYTNKNALSNSGKVYNIMPFKCSNDKSDEECLKIQHQTMEKGVKIFQNNYKFKDLQNKKVSVEIMFVGDEMPNGHTFNDIVIAENGTNVIVGIPNNEGKGIYILNELDRPSDIYEVKNMKFILKDHVLVVAIPFK